MAKEDIKKEETIKKAVKTKAKPKKETTVKKLSTKDNIKETKKKPATKKVTTKKVENKKIEKPIEKAETNDKVLINDTKKRPTTKKVATKKVESKKIEKPIEKVETNDKILIDDTKKETKKKPIKETNSLNFYKADKTKIGMIEVIFSSVVICIIGVLIGFLLSNQGNKTNYEKPKTDESLAEFIEVYQYILDNYYGDTEITKDALIEAALQGVLNSLNDPNSVYMDETASENFNITLEGSYEGLGIEIVNNSQNGTGEITILTVFANSPAEKAGLKPGNKILKINDEDLSNQTTAYFANKVKYGTESTFKLLVDNNGKTFETTVVRNKVILESVTSKVFEKNNKKIGYIYTSIFANNTYEQFKIKLEELEKQGIDSLIIDFRNNSGGHMYAARKMLSLFLDGSKIVYQTEDKTGIIKTYSEGTVNKTYKIVLLTNESSASSSEIVIAGLKENLNAIQIGTKTYGKGTVQELQDLPNGAQYKFTTKKWLTPKGNWINGIGIIPDYEIYLDEKYAKNPSDETDNQLQKALEILQK